MKCSDALKRFIRLIPEREEKNTYKLHTFCMSPFFFAFSLKVNLSVACTRGRVKRASIVCHLFSCYSRGKFLFYELHLVRGPKLNLFHVCQYLVHGLKFGSRDKTISF